MKLRSQPKNITHRNCELVTEKQSHYGKTAAEFWKDEMVDNKFYVHLQQTSSKSGKQKLCSVAV